MDESPFHSVEEPQCCRGTPGKFLFLLTRFFNGSCLLLDLIDLLTSGFNPE